MSASSLYAAAWHYDMLHDRQRNAAYAAGLQRVVQPGDIVLDIGCGSGLLSLLAARAGVCFSLDFDSRL